MTKFDLQIKTPLSFPAIHFPSGLPLSHSFKGEMLASIKYLEKQLFSHLQKEIHKIMCLCQGH